MPAGDLAMLPNRRRRRLLRTLFAFLGGLAAGFLFFAGPCSPHGGGAQWTLQEAPLHPVAQEEDPLKIVGLNPNDRVSLLFVGVMTARKYLSTRAVAVYDTWGSGIPGKIAFFSSEDSYRPEGRPDLPLVALRGVDDSYPPQKKSFLMLQYMWENYGRKFEWFLRADDDVYVRPDRLEAFLRSVDSKKAQFIGQAGRGNQEEFGLLSLEYDENFCMGGPGVIMSRETLSRVAPHLRQCLKNLYTTHEDVELGRCVQKYAGIPCTWSYEMQTILYHNSSGKDAFTGSLKQKEVHRAITLHPVKQYKHLYRIHNYMQMLKVQELQQDSLNLHRDILAMAKLLRLQLSNIKPEVSPFNKDYLGDSVLLGQLPGLKKYNPKSINEIQSWEFIQRALYSTSESNPKRRLESPLREGLDDVIREVMELINMYSKQRGRVIDFKEILYGYYQYNALYGADYILDMLLVYKKYRGRKMTVPVRRHAYLQQQFTGMEIREIREGKVGDVLSSDDQADYLTENNSGGLRETLENGVIKIGQSLPIVLSQGTTSGLEEFQRIERKVINFILPLAGRFESFRRFITVFENVCLKKKERVTLTVVIFLNDEDKSVHSSMELVKDLQARYHYTRIAIIPVFDNFARAKALQVGASHVHAPDDLLFFIDVDVIFRSPALYRIRTQTIRGKQVYFPIVFSEFDPQVVYNMSVSPNHFLISNDAGFWRQYGFGIASVYKSDLIKVGGFNTSIRGWGKEDVDLFDKFISTAQNLTVFRSVDRDLIHVFHVVECDSQLEESQLRMCKGTRADTYGSVQQLAEVIRHSRLKPRPDNYVHKQTNS